MPHRKVGYFSWSSGSISSATRQLAGDSRRCMKRDSRTGAGTEHELSGYSERSERYLPPLPFSVLSHPGPYLKDLCNPEVFVMIG